MNFIGGSDTFRYFKIISVNNKKVKDDGRYKTKGSPGDSAKKAFTQLSKKYKTNKLTFSIKETTQGSNKKEHGPYLGEKIKLKKPLTVKYKGKNGKNKPVIIKYETKIHLVKERKQKGGNGDEDEDEDEDGNRGENSMPEFLNVLQEREIPQHSLEDYHNLRRYLEGELRAPTPEHAKFLKDLIVKATNFCIEYPSYKKKCIKILNHALCVEKITRDQEMCIAKALEAFDNDNDMNKFIKDNERCGNETNLHKCDNLNSD